MRTTASVPAGPVLVGGARCLVGALMVARPRRLLDRVQPGPLPPYAAGLAVVLGLREIAQGALLAAGPRLGTRHESLLLRAGLAVDVLHLTTMVAAALPRGRYRRPALAGALQASADVLGELALRRR